MSKPTQFKTRPTELAIADTTPREGIPVPSEPARIPLSVRTKAVIAAFLIFTVSIGAGGIFLLVMQTRQLEVAHRERADLIARSLRSGLNKAMVQGRPRDLHELLSAYGGHNADTCAEILNPDHRVVATSRTSRLGAKVPLRDDLPFNAPYFTKGRLDGGPATTRVEPLRNEGVCRQCHDPAVSIIGFLNVTLSRQDLEEKLASQRDTLLATGLLTLGLLLIASWAGLSRLVVQPISELVATMRRAQGGDLNVRAEVSTSDDELAWLARSFNAMVAQLSIARSKLEETYRQRLVLADRFATTGELASGLAHEIKNPLAGLSGALQIIAEDLRDDPEKAEVAAEMQRQIDRLDHAMNGLLTFARPKPPRPEPIRVDGIIERVLLLLRQQKSAEQVEMKIELGSEKMTNADAAQLEQVFLNLCLNALQAMPGGGVLTVRSWDDRDDVVVAVQDSGAGIPNKVAPYLFRPFFTTKTSGTGLGLAICRRIVIDHDGDLYFESPREGGARFIVRLPLARREELEHRADPSEESRPQ